jgi:hypothetical protein
MTANVERVPRIGRREAPIDQADADDALATLLPEHAEVVVGLIGEARRVAFHRSVWLLRFRIVEAEHVEHVGRVIAWWLRALEKHKSVSRASAIATSFVAATGLRPPRDLARRRPSWWLTDAHYRVRTRQVRRDVHKVARAEAASYSVVDCVLERVGGAPPALQERVR